MKPRFTFNLGNRGLLPEELGLVEQVNAVLDASARRHGIKLKPTARLILHVSYPAGHPVYRVSAAGQEPILVPLAAGARSGLDSR